MSFPCRSVSVWQPTGGFTEEETSWGETRFSAVQGKEMTCRLVEEGDGSDIEGLLAYGQWEGVLLYPTENHIAAGSQVEVTKPDGREVIFFTTGETLSYSTHKEMVLTRKCPF